jgi:endoglucanase
LTEKFFNPDIFGNGTFNETTHTLITGQWGFGGWWYNNGLNLSGYKYLVAQLGADNKSSISFRVFDENNYWSGAAEYNFGTKRQVVVTLSNMVKAGKTTKLDPSHIYIVGFWSSGNSPIVIKNVFLSNSAEYGPTNSIKEISDLNQNENEVVDVFTIMGVRMRSQVKREHATDGLPNGVYIVGRQKVLVTNYK